MLRATCLTLATVACLAAALPAHAQAPHATHKSGEIRGRVTWCGGAPAAEAIAHLPGKSFQARLAPSGDFQIYWVPVGRHSLAIDAPGRAPQVVEDVVVTDRRVTELAAITLCRDADGDSSTEDVDCNDNNPSVHPGAAEACDGYDNDCDGTVDEGCLICTDADQDGFFAQAGCGTPVDCNDALALTRPGAPELCDAADNDCDTTVDETFAFATDASNCGSCGIVCPVRGPGLPPACILGACVMPEPQVEVCDEIDNDLDGLVDEGFNVGASCLGHGCLDDQGFPPGPGVRVCTMDGGVTCECLF